MEILVEDRGTESGVDLEDIRRLAEKTLISEHAADAAQLSIVLVDTRTMRELNSKYRGQDSPTDVLSFAVREGEVEPSPEAGSGEREAELVLGDIVISPEVAETNAQQYRHSLQDEVRLLVVHGVLHLLGYDHTTEDDKLLMWNRQDELLAAYGGAERDR